jgi:hypothetical protein
VSGSIFGDDDDFELVGGSDTPSAIRKPPAENPATRPATRPTPSTPSSNTEASKTTRNRTIPAATNSSGLPRPMMPPTSKLPARQPLPMGWEDAFSGNPKPKHPSPEGVEAVKPINPATRDTTASQERREAPSVQRTPAKDNPTIPASDRYVERGSSPSDNVAQDTRRSIRNDANGRYDDLLDSDSVIEDRFASRKSSDTYPQEEIASQRLREESPKSLYSQKPYVPAENPVQVPPREERTVQSYPDAHTPPVVKHSEQDLPVQKNKPAKATRVPRGKQSKAEKAKGPSNFSGARSGVVVVRVFAIAVVTMLMLAGGKSVFFPTQIPDPTTITNVVKKRLGVTNFPTESGQAFVTSFAKLYLTVDPANLNSTDVYGPYMSSTLASSMTASNGVAAKQTITEGPIISGVKSVDDSNAIYTVGAKLSSGANWIYVDVPVYYDKDNVGFAISGMPAFAPAPTKITAPQAGAPFERDSKLGDDVKASVMEQFFPAWAASNTAGINLVVLKDANSEAKIGLANSVKFVSIQDFTVEMKQSGDPAENTRKAQATVVWASPTDAKITYTQQYSLVLYRQPDNRWYIKQLTSGAIS